MGLLNRSITKSIGFHDTLYGFREGQVVGAASIDVKILQQLTEMKEEFLYEIFLGLHKDHDALDMYWCLDILAGYIVGPWSILIFRM